MNAQKHASTVSIPPDEGAEKLDVRTRLLNAGLELIMQRGYHATSINDIVELATIPKGSFYYYFKSKEAFGIDLVEYYADTKRHVMDELTERTDLTPLAKLFALVATWVNKMEESGYSQGCLISTIGAKLGDEDRALRTCLDNLHEEWTQRLLTFFSDAQAAGEFPKTLDMPRLVETFILMIQGAIIDAKITRNPGSFNTLYWLFFEHLGQFAKPLPADLVSSSIIGKPVKKTAGKHS